jgi:hypothetical protein
MHLFILPQRYPLFLKECVIGETDKVPVLFFISFNRPDIMWCRADFALPLVILHKIQESGNDENTPSSGFWNVHLFTPSNTLTFFARSDPTVKISGNPEITAMLTGQIQTI